MITAHGELVMVNRVSSTGDGIAGTGAPEKSSLPRPPARMVDACCLNPYCCLDPAAAVSDLFF
eukprot:SAG31_NODE_4785_length_2956_cov_23.715086_1_plen_63_part_00